MLKKTQLVVIIFTALVFFVLGYLIKGVMTNPNGQLSNETNTFQAGWDAAKTRLVNSGYLNNDANTEVKILMGEIKEINGDKITIKIRPVEPLADESLDTRIVIVNSTTKIYSLEKKNQEEYLAEMVEYASKKSDSNPIAPPLGFNKNEISLSDLKVGQAINVFTEKDIKGVKEFTALEINYRPILLSPVSATSAIPATTAPVK